MNSHKLRNRFAKLLSLFVAIVVASSPLAAQQKHPAPKRRAAEAPTPAPTFDTLLAADSYKIYCEVRGVGGLIRSSAVSDLLDPIMKLGAPPKEFKELVAWLNAHSDVLAGSRMMVAGWATRPNLPNVLVAVEFSSPEEAKKFYPELRDFMPTLLPTPTPTPSPTPTPAELSKTGSRETTAALTGTAVAPVAQPQQIAAVAEKETAPPVSPYQMRQIGSLVLISDTKFTLRNLNPPGSKPLEEDPNFLLARNRFASESIFLYIDVKSIEKEEQDRRKGYEEEEQKRIEEEARNPPKPEESATVAEPELSSEVEQQVPSPEPEPTFDPEQPTEVPAGDLQTTNDSKLAVAQQPDDELTPLFYSLYTAFFGGQTKWPEAIGAALVFEGDAYVVRTLIVNASENKDAAIPFVPQFVSGPAITPESPNIFPADTDLFISASVDYPQIYEGLSKAMIKAREQMLKNSGASIPDDLPVDAPFAAYEKKLGIKIKDDLLPLLGNEIALTLPRKATVAVNEATPNPQPGELKPGASNQQIPVQSPNPVIAISIKDREGVQKLIPRIIESFGFKGAGMFAQTEKRDGTEIVSYAGVFSYAFVGNFLVISPDPKETRRVVDAYLNHQTLASDSHFRNSTRWQPRQVQGQVFMSPGFVEQYLTGGGGYGTAINEKTSEFLARVNPAIDPVTYALTNDGLGPLHEMHVPKNLVMLQVVAISAQSSESLPATNEAVAKSVLRMVGNAEASFKATEKSYGTLDQLVSAGLLSKDLMEKYGYKLRWPPQKTNSRSAPFRLSMGKPVSCHISLMRARSCAAAITVAALLPLQINRSSNSGRNYS